MRWSSVEPVLQPVASKKIGDSVSLSALAASEARGHNAATDSVSCFRFGKVTSSHQAQAQNSRAQRLHAHSNSSIQDSHTRIQSGVSLIFCACIKLMG